MQKPKRGHTRLELENMSLAEFYLYAEEVIRPNHPKRGSGLHVHFPMDLRNGEDTKYKEASPFYTWTAFMNNAGTLCHVVCPEDEIIIRVRFVYPVKHLSLEKMKAAVLARIVHRVIL